MPISPTRRYAEPVNDAAKKRALARAGWTIRKFRLHEEEEMLAPEGATPSECVALTQALSLRAWELTGQPFPSCRPDELPIRVIRVGRST